MNILKSATGHYDQLGNPADADVIIGHSFGTSTHHESPNGRLARFILDSEDGQPVVVDRTLAEAFPKSHLIDVVVDGAVSDVLGSTGGSWEILEVAKEYMDTEGLAHPLMVAQAFHIGRVAMQAKKIGMADIIVPANLPTAFDKVSDQVWTRSSALWVPREIAGSFVLRHQHKL